MNQSNAALLSMGMLVAVGYLFNGNENPDAWAALFWLSGICNVILLVLLADARVDLARLRGSQE